MFSARHPPPIKEGGLASAPRGRHRVAAPIIRAIDQQAAHAHVAHVGKGDLRWAGEGEHARDDSADRDRSEAATARCDPAVLGPSLGTNSGYPS